MGGNLPRRRAPCLLRVLNRQPWVWQVGVNFLALLARSGVGGGILADEMGLGKTAQAIAFLGARL